MADIIEGQTSRPMVIQSVPTYGKVHEMKLKERSRDKFDTILTGITAQTPEMILKQAANIASWGCGARVYVSCSDVTFTEGHIKTEVPKESNNPSLKEVIGQTMMDTPGNRVIAICDPDVVLGGNAEPLFQQVDTAKMQLSWAAYAGTPWPKIFIMSAQIIPYFWREIPVSIKFGTSEWREWMDKWLTISMPQHRYFNANSYGIVIEMPAEAIPSPSGAVYEPAPTEAPKKVRKYRQKKIIKT